MKTEGYVYLLQSEKDNSFYFGSTKDLDRRVQEHSDGKSASTRNKRPWKLVYSLQLDDIVRARKIEQVLKSRKEKVSVAWFMETLGKYER